MSCRYSGVVMEVHQSSYASPRQPANFALELTRGPFLGTRKSNCTASRWLLFAPSEALVSRGSQHAAVRPARGARAQLSDGRWADNLQGRSKRVKNPPATSGGF